MYPETITSSYCLIDKLTGMTSQTVVVSSFIVGIHTTNVGSHQEIELVVEEDDSVPDIDRDCMLVRHPERENLPHNLEYVVTYPRSRRANSRRTRDQYAFQVSGYKVGNVPAKLCGAFRSLKATRDVTRI